MRQTSAGHKSISNPAANREALQVQPLAGALLLRDAAKSYLVDLAGNFF